MIRPYKKHQMIPERDISCAERLEPARAAVRHAIKLLEQFSDMTDKAWDGLSDAQLQTICNAAESAFNAAQNCAFLGVGGYNGYPVRMVVWEDAGKNDEEDWQ
jgi:hypothetical protein